MIDITGIPILASRLAEAQKAARRSDEKPGLTDTHDPVGRAIQELLAVLTALDRITIEKNGDADVALDRMHEALDDLRKSVGRTTCAAQ